MDIGIIFLLSLLLVIFVSICVKKMSHLQESRPPQLIREKRKSILRTSWSDSSDRSPTLLCSHPSVSELRTMSLDDLERKDILHGRTTDRYWREIYRRYNESHPPDCIHIERLSAKAVITAIEEAVPSGIHTSFTLTGISQRLNPQTHASTLKHLRKRFPSSIYEISVNEEKTVVRRLEERCPINVTLFS